MWFLRALIIIFALTSITALANNDNDTARYPNPIYLGITLGYGSTTWGSLIDKNKHSAANVATPIKVHEGGFVYGFYAGYEFSPYFAIETHYTHYQTADVYFLKTSDYYILYKIKEIRSKTEAYNINAKVMAPFFHTKLRVYADAGAATIHRSDKLARTNWHLGPTFGAGANYLVNSHFMIEAGFQYYTGWGKSQVDPVDNFIPFLYDAQLRLAYRFDVPGL